MEYEIYHHGTKGMKWGVRRYQNKDGSLTPLGKRRLKSVSFRDSDKPGYKEATYEFKMKKKDADAYMKSLSDADLRKTINRLQMEQQYAQLTQRKKSAGEKFVKGVIIGSATAVATKYVSKYMTQGVEWALKNI